MTENLHSHSDTLISDPVHPDHSYCLLSVVKQVLNKKNDSLVMVVNSDQLVHLTFECCNTCMKKICMLKIDNQ